MQTITIHVDDHYLDSILNFLKDIPKNKREIFQHTKIDISSSNMIKKEDDFLSLLESGPTISEYEAGIWEKNIKEGHALWKIEEF
ncbi:MAG: hypothetical protein Q9M36_10240 [Sulfurovum sp.]|nr:hypothetical protein [Sulfurovum sp.]